MWINQDAVFSLGTFDPAITAKYTIKYPGNVAYVFLIEGKVRLDGIMLDKRDAAVFMT